MVKEINTNVNGLLEAHLVKLTGNKFQETINLQNNGIAMDTVLSEFLTGNPSDANHTN